MAGDPNTIKGIIKRLDRLDGRVDGRYTDLPLYGQNTTGLCEVSEIAHKELGDRAEIQHRFDNFSGESVDVDCKGLAAHLGRLAGIAEKLPRLPFQLHNHNLSREEFMKRLSKLSFEDFLCYHIVDHMITSLMLGVNPADITPKELFSTVDFRQYTSGIHLIGKRAGIENWLAGRAENAAQGFEIFAAAGKKYGFDISPFKP